MNIFSMLFLQSLRSCDTARYLVKENHIYCTSKETYMPNFGGSLGLPRKPSSQAQNLIEYHSTTTLRAGSIGPWAGTCPDLIRTVSTFKAEIFHPYVKEVEPWTRQELWHAIGQLKQQSLDFAFLLIASTN